MQKIKIALVDDHPLFIVGVTQFITAFGDMEVVATGTTLAEAKHIFTSVKPDVLLLDIDLPDGKGIKLLEDKKRSPTNTKIVMLSMYHDHIHIQLSEERGADGYLAKNIHPTDMAKAIRWVHTNGTFYSSMIVSPTRLLDRLSKRENEVLEYLSEGKSREYIADVMCISADTLKTHIKNILSKTQHSSVIELVAQYLSSKV